MNFRDVPVDAGARNCRKSGCECNCCDKRSNKHCESHVKGCHLDCG